MNLKIKISILFGIFSLSWAVVGYASADYYAQGILESTNMLSGADVSVISGFQITATIPVGTTVKVKFSQDRVNYYNASGVKDGWDNCANGITNINLSGLGWTGGLLFYKIQLATTDAVSTPVVSEAQVDYTGTAVPPLSGIAYYGQGILASTNMLSGATVTAINSFQVTANVPAGTTVSVKFSQDRINYYNSSGVKDGWDSCANGITNINLSGLGWTGGSLFYKMRLESLIDNALVPSVSEISIGYDGGEVPPPSGNAYYSEGTFVSTNLLAGSGAIFNESERFGYAISSLPFGTSVYAQFSRDGVNYYNSSGTLWGWDTLSSGTHLSFETALDLYALRWKGATGFYYKLRFTATVDNGVSPVLTDAGLLRRSAVVNSSNLPLGSKVTVNASQTGKLTNGLVLMQSFDGPHMDWSQAIAEARDQSGQGKHGDAVNMTQTSVAPGKIGQALDFNGTNNYVSCGPVGSGIKTVAFWMKADAVSGKKIMDFDGTRQIEISAASQITATGFPAATIYVDGVASSVIDSDWHHIAITDSAGVSGLAVDLGRVSSGYFDGKLDEVRFYDRVLSTSEIGNLYRLGNAKIVR